MIDAAFLRLSLRALSTALGGAGTALLLLIAEAPPLAGTLAENAAVLLAMATGIVWATAERDRSPPR